MKKKAKNILMIIVMIAIGGLFGYMMGRFVYGPGGKPNDLIYFLLFLLSSYVINVLLHEAGHMIAGLIGGWKYSSYRIFNLMILKDEEGFKVKKFKLPGTLGQCLMVPPPVDKLTDKSIFIYNAGGVAMNILLAILSALIFFACDPGHVMRLFLITWGFLNICMALENAVPLYSMSNDGANIMLTRKKPETKEWIVDALLINDAETRGRKFSEMPDEWFTMPKDEEMTNALASGAMINNENRAMERGEYDEALRLSELLLGKHKGNLISVQEALVLSDNITVRLLKGEDVYVDKERRKLLKSASVIPQVMRSLIALALLVDKDEKTYNKLMKKNARTLSSWPYQAEKDTEERLLAEIKECPEKTQKDA